MTTFTDFDKQGVLAGFSHDAWDDKVYSAIVIQEASGLYRMFYTAYQSDGVVYGPATATSTDFTNWTKPNLGLITWGGNANNNLIIFNDVMELADVVWEEGQYVALTHNKTTSSSQLWTSPDGEAWTFNQNAFTGHEVSPAVFEYAEPKCILYINGIYRLYYNHHGVQRRSLGYQSSATVGGTFVDQGIVAEFTSTDQDVQFYDMFTWQQDDFVYACVPNYNKTSEVLGPLQLYQSGNHGFSWEKLGNIIENGANGEFDDGLIAAGKPILIDDKWRMIYVGSDDTHNIWPRTMQFAGSQEMTVALTNDSRLNRPVTDTLTDDDYIKVVDNPSGTAQTHYAALSTLRASSSVSANAEGPEILDEASTFTNPTLVPNRAYNSGIGGNVANLSVIVNGVAIGFFEASTNLAATETSLWLFDDDNNALQQVTVGADDSGGAGFKVLRIAN